MEHSKKRGSIIKYKVWYTVVLLLVYMLGKSFPLYMIDIAEYLHRTVNAETLLMQTISGDIYQCSLFTLGISPYMISSIIVQIISALRNSDARAKISPSKTNKLSLALTLVLAVLLAMTRVQGLKFKVTGDMLLVAKMVAGVEMVAGAMMVLWLSSRNKKYGIGGQSALILINIIDGIRATVQGHSIRELAVPLLVSLMVVIIMIIMENTEKRIPVQRISIHNIYADKNYLAIKMNPIGVMPAMFSMAFFMLLQLITVIPGWFLPENAEVMWWQENMTLAKPLGIGMYIIVLYCLTIGFSRVFVNPKEITEQFLKSGDSIRDIHAGRDTRKYLSGVITRISFISGTVMGVCLGIPLVLQLVGSMGSTFATLPSSMMMLTGICCNLYREVRAIKDLEAYRPFI